MKIVRVILAFVIVVFTTMRMKAQNTSDSFLPVVSATKMNILYAGLPNPVAIAVPGYKSEDLQVSISNGNITEGNLPGEYYVVCPTPGSVAITISCNGKSLNRFFRVRRIPDPNPSVGSTSPYEEIAKNSLVNNAIVAKLGNFDFDVRFVVEGFTVSIVIDGDLKQEHSDKATFSAAQKALILRAPVGSKVFIEDIKVKGPDEFSRILPPIWYILK